MATTKATVKCTRCGRALRSAKSVADGYGRTCKARIAAARKAKAVEGVKPAAVAKAEELIELGAIVPLRGRRVFGVVASNGTDRYLTAPQACTCPAGLKSLTSDYRLCYHRVAAAILAAA
ncbi:DUF6011 domain-containing protein [Saccharothrix lopnurensis]|uniref:DUF6011 domain-containing protein n=1 Tax=Saccharothrix lopnurensis TaxID=1670621 RepID=A0ABW1P5I3_9PSEU